ncbi:MAG TPA: GGDEF domain-containing protein [Qipengyuania sp.]|nr:GGDEF domain-containing protein [Qipengyuania sp.]
MSGGHPSRKGIYAFAFAALAAAAVPVLSLAGVGPMAIVLLAILSLAALVVHERGTVLRLAHENSALAQSVSLLELAESLAGVGRWRYEPATGVHQWSPELCALIGIYPPRQPDDALLCEILGPSGGGLHATLSRHKLDRDAYQVEFEVVRPDGEHRLLRCRARNEFAAGPEADQVFMVARDVTEEYEQARRLKAEQEMALATARRAQELANTDPLTGLANRRYAMSEIDRAIMLARKHKTFVSLVVFDLDHFKEVNDTHGHIAGDRVLARVARLAQMLVPEGGLVARFGGEEFVVLLQNADTRDACEFSEKLRWSIETGSAGEDLPGVTTSIGYACFETADTSLTLFARADAALYEAKSAGRNQVRMAA